MFHRGSTDAPQGFRIDSTALHEESCSNKYLQVLEAALSFLHECIPPLRKPPLYSFSALRLHRLRFVLEFPNLRPPHGSSTARNSSYWPKALRGREVGRTVIWIPKQSSTVVSTAACVGKASTRTSTREDELVVDLLLLESIAKRLRLITQGHLPRGRNCPILGRTSMSTAELRRSVAPHPWSIYILNSPPVSVS